MPHGVTCWHCDRPWPTDEEARLRSEAEQLRGVVASLYRCENGLPGPRCPRLATTTVGGQHLCDVHGPRNHGWDLPWAAALRVLVGH